MNKSELIREVAKEANVSISEARKIVEATLRVITASLKAGEEVDLTGFGRFSVSANKEFKRQYSRAPKVQRSGRPSARTTGKSGRLPVFSPSQQLRVHTKDKDPDKTNDPGEFIHKGKK